MSIKLFSCPGGSLVLPDRALVLVSRENGGNLVANPPRPVWVARTESLLKSRHQMPGADIASRAACARCGYPTIRKRLCEEYPASTD